MIRWTCDKCGFSGLYNAQLGQEITCRNCHLVAVVRTEGIGKNRRLVAEGASTKQTSLAQRFGRFDKVRVWAILGVAVVGIAGFVTYRHVTAPPPGLLQDLNDPDVAKAVGLVVPTLEIKLPDGRIVDQPVGTGSCFVISVNGVALTNRHVVEQARDFGRAPLKAQIEREQNTKIVVKFWVFLNSEQLEAQLVYVDETDDLAILKLPITQPNPYFGIVESPLPRGDTVYALGYPGAARSPLSDQEKIEGFVRDVIASSVGARLRQHFSSRDFEYGQTKGYISRVVQEGSRTWVEHDAKIHFGNSGGPLLTADCRVIGINTQMVEVSSSGPDGRSEFSPVLYHALACWSLGDKIRKHVPAAVWR